jgi:hypothetical protein
MFREMTKLDDDFEVFGHFLTEQFLILVEK